MDLLVAQAIAAAVQIPQKVPHEMVLGLPPALAVGFAKHPNVSSKPQARPCKMGKAATTAGAGYNTPPAQPVFKKEVILYN